MTQKIVFQCDRNGYFIGETMADESPLEVGVWIMPGRTTEAAPPESWSDDKWPRWDGVAWVLVSKPVPANDNDPVAKLRAFLDANPDVAAIL